MHNLAVLSDRNTSTCFFETRSDIDSLVGEN